MKIGIFEPLDFSSRALNELARLGEVTCYRGVDRALFLRDLDVLFVRLGSMIDEEFLSDAPNVKFICTPTTGHTHLDESYIADRGISIISLRGQRDFLETVRATPEHTFGLVLALLRNYCRAFQKSENCLWDRDAFKGEELFGSTAGIIGCGRVGSRLVEYLRTFGVDVYFFDPNVEVVAGAQKCASILDLVEKSKIILLCASLNEGNFNLVNREVLAKMQDRYFINTARGELVDECALLDFLHKDYFRGVALDVISSEQGNSRREDFLDVADKFNVVLTPHIAGATYTSMHRTEEFIVKSLFERLGVGS